MKSSNYLNSRFQKKIILNFIWKKKKKLPSYRVLCGSHCRKFLWNIFVILAWIYIRFLLLLFPTFFRSRSPFFLRFLLLFLHFGLHFGWLMFYFWVRNRVLETRFPCRRHLEKVPRKRRTTHENRALKTRFRSPKSSL